MQSCIAQSLPQHLAACCKHRSCRVHTCLLCHASRKKIPSRKYLYLWPASLSLFLTCNHPEVLCRGACRKHGTTMIKSNFRSYRKESWDKYGPSCENYFEMFALGCCFSSFAVIQQCRDLVCLVKVPFELQCKKKKKGRTSSVVLLQSYFFISVSY